MRNYGRAYRLILGLLLGMTLANVGWAHPLPVEKVVSPHDFATTVRSLSRAVRSNDLYVVNRANAQRGAKSIKQTIAGNQVLGVFAPKFAVRLLQASVAAGIEAPLRIYVTEGKDGKTTVSYIKPSQVFAPYRNKKLDALAGELDGLFAKIMVEFKKPVKAGDRSQRRERRQRERKPQQRDRPGQNQPKN